MVGSDFALAVTAACTESVADGNLDVAVLLFALIGFSILNASDAEALCVQPYAFADDLRAFEGGITAASDGGLSGCAADMGVAVGGTLSLSAAFACVAAGGKAEAAARADGGARVPAAAFVFVLSAAVLFG